MILPRWRWRAARREGPVDSQRLDELCEFAPDDDAEQEELVFWLVKLVRWLRPLPTQSPDLKLRYLEAQLTRHPEWRAKLAQALSTLVARFDMRELVSYAGIPRDFHFLGALGAWLSERLLPAACRTRSVSRIFLLAFEEQDLAWLPQLARHPLLIGLIEESLHPALVRDLADSALDLAHQIVAQAHAPSIRSLAEVERSPFRGLHEAVAALHQAPSEAARLNALRGRIRQCFIAIDAHRASLAQRGADFNTTFQLARLRQQLKRLSLLGGLLHDRSMPQLAHALVELIDASLQDATGRRLVWGSSDLVLQNTVDTAASVGREYLSMSASSFAAFRAGAYGGVLMAIATMLKFLLSHLHLPQLYEGLVFSLNYAAAFCAAYLLHWTIATKLPANMATALARSVQTRASHRERLARFLEVWQAIVRLQLLGLVGNVIVVAPLGLALALGYRLLFQHDLVPLEKAQQVLTSHSLLGPSVLYAALTGLFLWISSLAGAIVDNWARVVGLTDRLATSVQAMRRSHVVRARARAERIASSIGGLCANVALGFMLGALPALFAIAELPVEIRHVTVSAGSLAMALLADTGTAQQWTLAVAGVTAIGATNVMVSFSLALWLALRSTRGLRRGGAANALVRIGLRRSLRRGASNPRATIPGATPSA